MWLMTSVGFYSIVKDQTNDSFKVRARAKKDLLNLTQKVNGLSSCKILTYPDADYRYRIIISEKQRNNLFDYFSNSIEYGNFKDAIYGIPNQRDKLERYHAIWQEMYEYQEEKITEG